MCEVHYVVVDGVGHVGEQDYSYGFRNAFEFVTNHYLTSSATP